LDVLQVVPFGRNEFGNFLAVQRNRKAFPMPGSFKKFGKLCLCLRGGDNSCFTHNFFKIASITF